jgi:hypothetical protein
VLKRLSVTLAVVSGALVTMTGSAGAITGGEIDGSRHPNVAMIVYYQPDGRFRCSATLVSPTVLVTAAHCTDGVRGKTIVTFAPVAPSPTPRAADDTGDGMSATGYTSAPAGWLTGRSYTHPRWDGELQLNDLHDVGVIVLDRPYTAATPAPLPPRGYLDGLSRGNGGLNKELFEVVGYGVFFEKPAEGPQRPASVADRTRRFTDAVGQNISSQVLKLAENEHDSRAGGGSCFGDSGGPAMHSGFVVGDASYVYTLNCRYLNGYQRVDIPIVRNWILDCVADLACPTKET